MGQRGKTERVELENPNPNSPTNKPNIHYHDASNAKHYYNPADGKFYENVDFPELSPRKIQKMLNDPWVAKMIKKALEFFGL